MSSGLTTVNPLSSIPPQIAGYYVSLAFSFVYDNGFESGMTEFTAPVYADGRKQLNVNGVPLGPVVAGATCVKRRIWQWVNFSGPTLAASVSGQGQSFGVPGAGGVGAAMLYAEVLDNTTAGFIASSDPNLVTATSSKPGIVVSPTQPGLMKALPNIVAPAGPTSPITSCQLIPAKLYTKDPGYDQLTNGVSFFTLGTNQAFQPGASFSLVPSNLHYVRYSWIYANGAESNWSPSASLSFQSGITDVSLMPMQNLGSNLRVDPNVVGDMGSWVFLSPFMPDFKGMQNPPAVNGVVGLGMIIYVSSGGDVWVPGSYMGIVVVPSIGIAASGYQPQFYSTCGRQTKLVQTGQSGSSGSGAIPVWPNPDGPSLETNPPDDITDDNPDLLHDPAFYSTVDLTQVRNRIHVQGAGTTVSVGANAGDQQVFVKDVTVFQQGSGQIMIDGLLMQYVGGALSSLTDNSGYIMLGTGLSRKVDPGSSVYNYLKVDDPKSQAALAQIEFDNNGQPTDGVHEYTVQDGSLIDNFGMFMAANAQLEVFSNPVVTIQYSTRDPKSKVGQFVKVNLTNPPCVGTFLIQTVTIDQVHDESDQVGPRYAVTASSANFTLDDLLLQISPRPASGGGGVGGGGASAAAASASSGDTTPTLSSQIDDQFGADQGSLLYRDASAWKALEPGGPGQVLQTNGPNANPSWVTPASASVVRINDLYRNTGRMFIVQSTAPGTGIGGQSIGFSAGAITNPTAQVSRTEGLYGNMATAASSGSFAGMVAPNASTGIMTDDQDFVADFQIGMDTVITNVRFQIGIGTLSNSSPSNNDNISAVSTNRFFYFRYSDAASDPGWVGAVWDGSTQQVTGAIVAAAVSTVFALRIRKVGTSIFFSANGGAETSLTTAALSSKALNPFWGVYTTTTAARKIWFSHMVISTGGPFF